MNKQRNILFLFIAALLMFAPSRAHAQCTNPTGYEGSQIYNRTYSVMQYCNGVNWIKMAASGKATSSIWQSSGSNIYYNLGSVGIGTATPTALLDVAGTLNVAGAITAGDAILLANDSVVTSCSVAGSIRYNTGKSSIEVCDGSSWKSSSASGFTQGSVPFADGVGDLTEDNTNLNWDNVNKELTVGNMINFKGGPGNQPVSTSQNISNLGDVNIAGPADGEVLTYNAGKWENIANPSIWTESGANIYYDAGNVGIGTNTPTAKLDVVGTAKIAKFGNPDFTDQHISVRPGNAGVSIGLDADLNIGTSVGSILLQSGVDKGIAFKTNSDTTAFGVTSPSLAIDLTGKVGIGTTTPQYNLEVHKTSKADPAIMIGNSSYFGGGPRLQVYDLDTDPNAWMGLGVDMTATPYEHNVFFPLGPTTNGRISFGSYDGSAYSEKMNITAAGKVNLGGSEYGSTASPTYISLGNSYSNGQTRDKLKLYLHNTGTEQYGFGIGGAGDIQYHSNAYHDFYTANTLRFRIEPTGNICGTDGAFEACSSDARLKKDIIDNKSLNLDKARKLRLINFEWNQLGVDKYNYPEDKKEIGFIAQEVQEFLPEWVSKDNKGYLRVEDGELRYLLLNSIQELATMHDTKQKEINDLRAEIEELKKLIKEQK